MGQVKFNNQILVEPQAKSSLVVGVAPRANPLATGRVIVLGASEGGAPDILTWFTDKNEAKSVLRSGDALRAIDKIFNPSAQNQGAPFVGFVRTQPATVAEYDATSGKIVSKDYGTWVNNIKVQVEDGTDSNSTKVTVGYGAEVEVHDNLDLALSVQYVGSATKGMLAVTAGDVLNGTSGPTTGLENVEFIFDTNEANYNTLQKVAAAINALADWTCSIYNNAPAGVGSLDGNVLNTLSATDVKAAEVALLAYPHIAKYSLDTFSVYVDGTVETDGTQLTNTTEWNFLTGGTAPAQDTAEITAALVLIEEANAQFVWVDSETAADHALVTAHCTANQYWREGIHGLASQATAALAISTASDQAALMNSARATLVACGIDDFTEDGSAIEALAPKFFAAIVTGIMAGLPVQEPGTHKVFTSQGLQYEFTKAQREALIRAGVLAPRNYDGIGLIINQSINTLQNNVNLWDAASDSSSEISLNRSAGAFNKELIVAADKQFIGGTVGVGRATIEGFISAHCKAKEADGTLAQNDTDPDNVLPAWENIVATRLDDGWSAKVSIRLNNPFNYFLLETTAII